MEIEDRIEMIKQGKHNDNHSIHSGTSLGSTSDGGSSHGTNTSGTSAASVGGKSAVL